MVIITDLDDVVINLLDAWIKWLNEKYNRTVTKQDIKQWDMSIPYEGLTDDQIYEPLNLAEFWKTVQPCKGAVKYIKKLRDEGHTVLIATSTYYKNLINKFENAVFPHFPYLSFKDIMICYHKGLIDCDILIDDYHQNLKNSKATRILVNEPYNVDCDKSFWDFRVKPDDWEFLYKLIHELEPIIMKEKDNERITN